MVQFRGSQVSIAFPATEFSMAAIRFFIVGAPKCGTSAMYEYLRSHPAIFMPRLKEPEFFATDLSGLSTIRTEAEYHQLFSDGGSHSSACGEASVFYLYSSVAVQRILDFDPSAKFLAMVRNPLQMYPSLHSQFLYSFFEDEADCSVAWRLQERRLRGERIPKLCKEPKLLQYAPICSLGEQVSRLFSQVPVENRKVVIFDDFENSPQKVYEEVLAFLGIESDGRTDFPLVNKRKSHKNGVIGRFLQSPPRFLENARNRLKRSYYLHGSLMGRMAYKILEWSRRFNSRIAGRSQLSDEFAAELADVFRDDVQLLASLVERDLGHWLSIPAKTKQ